MTLPIKSVGWIKCAFIGLLLWVSFPKDLYIAAVNLAYYMILDVI